MHEQRYRIFNTRPHQTNAKLLFAATLVQLVLGVFLKVSPHEPNSESRTARARVWAVRAHGVVGKVFPILGWMQILFGVIGSRNYCVGDTNFEKCLTHYGMVCTCVLPF